MPEINYQNNINGTSFDAYLLLDNQNIEWSETQNVNPTTDNIFDSFQRDLNNPQILFISLNDNGIIGNSYLLSGLKTEIVNTSSNNQSVQQQQQQFAPMGIMAANEALGGSFGSSF